MRTLNCDLCGIKIDEEKIGYSTIDTSEIDTEGINTGEGILFEVCKPCRKKAEKAIYALQKS
jgi:hypothetical protein